MWFRRDLRLGDNAALQAALDRHDQVLPVFIHDPEAESPWKPGGASEWWLHHSLDALMTSLRKRGADLVIRSGDSLECLRDLVKATSASAVYWNRLYEPALITRDTAIKDALRVDGAEAESFNSALLFEPWTLRTGGGDPYRVFTPFWRNASVQLNAQLGSGRAPLSAPRKIPVGAKLPSSVPLAELQLLPRIAWDAGLRQAWTPGEAGALSRLEHFADGAVAQYREGRDLPGIDATSGLSAALHFGEVSPLQLVARMERLKAGESASGVHANAEWFLRELGWREFAHHLLFHFPKTPDEPLYAKFAPFPWRKPRDYAADLAAWQQGRTGVPIVDAGMRQLWHTGFMHNRVRMIVASFLTKNLLIPWQEGARWFWDTLVDASLANNTLGWQWTAGCGADASPYFRIFNPVLQSERFDAEGAYLRRWLPELAKLPSDSLHAPWKAKAAVLKSAGLRLGEQYPEAIVDLSTSRDRALEAYQRMKAAS